MRVRHRLAVTVVAILLTASGAVAARAFTASPAGSVRGVAAFVGDSNIVLGATRREITLTPSAVGYVPVDVAAVGASIRWSGCLPTAACPDPAFADYWAVRLAAVRSRLVADVYVVDLGVNDTAILGDATSTGYAWYGLKIDWLMALLPAARPVLWTNLPCSLEPAVRHAGCLAVNAALSRAPARWPNLTVVDWQAAATGHPEYMVAVGNVHYSAAGYDAYTAVVLAALNAKLS